MISRAAAAAPRPSCSSPGVVGTGLPRKSSRKLLAPCRFATGFDFAHYLQEEVTIEGVLHVSAAQAGSCMERFGDFDGVAAPALPSLKAVLASSPEPADGTSSSSPAARGVHASSAQVARVTPPSRASERVVNEAFCLATPPDNPAEGTTSPVRVLREGEVGRDAPGARLQPLAARNNNSSSSRTTPVSAVTREAEEVLQLEATAAYQRAYLSAQAMYTSEVLQASAAIRRQRRRKLVRLLRNGRDMTSSGLSALQSTPPVQLLASIGSSISSLASWDDDPVAAQNDARGCGGAGDDDDTADSKSKV